MDSTLDATKRENYRFHKIQLGFRRDENTYVAIMRSKNITMDRHPYVAVFDLSAGYDRVPRDILLKRLKEKLPLQIPQMVSYILKP